MQETDRDNRHKKRAQAVKEKHDKKVAKATLEQGVSILLAGPGKGKSSSAFGMLARSLGHGQKAAVVQFIKGRVQTGEANFFAEHPRVDFNVMGNGFTWDTQNRQQDVAAAEKAWDKAKSLLANPDIRLLILDEITYMYKYDYLPLQPLLDALVNRPKEMNVVLTGRNPKQELIDAVDTYSLILCEKHAFRAGIKAQPGIEW